MNFSDETQEQKKSRDCLLKTPITVLHVVHWPISGIVSFLTNFLHGASNSEFHHSVIFFNRDTEEGVLPGPSCEKVYCLGFAENPLKALLSFWRVLKDLKPDIIHTHSFQPGFWARIFSLGTDSQIVSTIHSPYPYLKGQGLLGSLKRLMEISGMNLRNSKVICVAEEVKRYLCVHTRIRNELLEVIRNGISPQETDSFELARARKELPPDGETKIIIIAGRLSEEKGLDILLSAFARIKRKRDDVRLVILGKGPLEKELREYAARLNIEPYVQFLGYKKNIFPYLALAYLYVNSSYYEGLPMSILEAMAAGVPVVASKVGGIPEIVEDNVSGALIEPGDPDSLSDAIMRVLDNELLAKHFSANGLKRADMFHISQTVRAYETLYSKLLAQRG